MPVMPWYVKGYPRSRWSRYSSRLYNADCSVNLPSFSWWGCMPAMILRWIIEIKFKRFEFILHRAYRWLLLQPLYAQLLIVVNPKGHLSSMPCRCLICRLIRCVLQEYHAVLTNLHIQSPFWSNICLPRWPRDTWAQYLERARTRYWHLCESHCWIQSEFFCANSFFLNRKHRKMCLPWFFKMHLRPNCFSVRTNFLTCIWIYMLTNA